MFKKSFSEFSAFVYQQNNVFFADCTALNMVTCGSNEIEAVQQLEKNIQEILSKPDVMLKLIYERR